MWLIGCEGQPSELFFAWLPMLLVFAVGAYLIGSINFSIILSKLISGKDIRESGSGNAGATNMLRTYGKKMGVITLILDVLKGVVCIAIANIYTNHVLADSIDSYSAVFQNIYLSYIVGLCVVLGHNFPLYFKFKGGKGVATSLGVVLMLDWRIGLLIGICAIAVMAITRYVSFGSILGGIAFVVGELVKMAVAGEWNVIKLMCVVLIGGMLVARHHANITRLLNGTENKLGAKKKEN